MSTNLKFKSPRNMSFAEFQSYIEEIGALQLFWREEALRGKYDIAQNRLHSRTKSVIDYKDRNVQFD